MDINSLIAHAVNVNAGYSAGFEEDHDDHQLNVGFLYGTAELIIAITGLLPSESYNDKREVIAAAIDAGVVAQGGVSVLTDHRSEPEGYTETLLSEPAVATYGIVIADPRGTGNHTVSVYQLTNGRWLVHHNHQGQGVTLTHWEADFETEAEAHIQYLATIAEVRTL